MKVTRKQAAGRKPATRAKQPAQAQPESSSLLWGNLIHLSYNMWFDRIPRKKSAADMRYSSPELRWHEGTWRAIVRRMVKTGLNMMVIDLGDGVKYRSHPEIAVRGAWSVARLRRELAALRKQGIEPIPKLNFSTAHDHWLGPYSRCVSTDTYYAICRDLIAEVIDLFDRPRMFHLGMDEETPQDQRNFNYVVVRQHELWWDDLYFYIDCVQQGGVRAWIWSDYAWDHPDKFYKLMPRSVVQSNWYYGDKFNRRDVMAGTYLDLEEHGYDQIPTGSNWNLARNFGRTVEYLRRRIAPERLLGFLQTSWKPTLRAEQKRHFAAIDQVGRARKVW